MKMCFSWVFKMAIQTLNISHSKAQNDYNINKNAKISTYININKNKSYTQIALKLVIPNISFYFINNSQYWIFNYACSSCPYIYINITFSAIYHSKYFIYITNNRKPLKLKYDEI